MNGGSARVDPGPTATHASKSSQGSHKEGSNGEVNSVCIPATENSTQAHGNAPINSNNSQYSSHKAVAATF